jgi:hypothetical protein
MISSAYKFPVELRYYRRNLFFCFSFLPPHNGFTYLQDREDGPGEEDNYHPFNDS